MAKTWTISFNLHYANVTAGITAIQTSLKGLDSSIKTTKESLKTIGDLKIEKTSNDQLKALAKQLRVLSKIEGLDKTAVSVKNLTDALKVFSGIKIDDKAILNIRALVSSLNKFNTDKLNKLDASKVKELANALNTILAGIQVKFSSKEMEEKAANIIKLTGAIAALVTSLKTYETSIQKAEDRAKSFAKTTNVISSSMLSATGAVDRYSAALSKLAVSLRAAQTKGLFISGGFSSFTQASQSLEIFKSKVNSILTDMGKIPVAIDLSKVIPNTDQLVMTFEKLHQSVNASAKGINQLIQELSTVNIVGASGLTEQKATAQQFVDMFNSIGMAVPKRLTSFISNATPTASDISRLEIFLKGEKLLNNILAHGQSTMKGYVDQLRDLSNETKLLEVNTSKNLTPMELQDRLFTEQTDLAKRLNIQYQELNFKKKTVAKDTMEEIRLQTELNAVLQQADQAVRQYGSDMKSYLMANLKARTGVGAGLLTQAELLSAKTKQIKPSMEVTTDMSDVEKATRVKVLEGLRKEYESVQKAAANYIVTLEEEVAIDSKLTEKNNTIIASMRDLIATSVTETNVLNDLIKNLKALGAVDDAATKKVRALSESFKQLNTQFKDLTVVDPNKNFIVSGQKSFDVFNQMIGVYKKGQEVMLSGSKEEKVALDTELKLRGQLPGKILAEATELKKLSELQIAEGTRLKQATDPKQLAGKAGIGITQIPARINEINSLIQKYSTLTQVSMQELDVLKMEHTQGKLTTDEYANRKKVIDEAIRMSDKEVAGLKHVSDELNKNTSLLSKSSDKVRAFYRTSVQGMKDLIIAQGTFLLSVGLLFGAIAKLKEAFGGLIDMQTAVARAMRTMRSEFLTREETKGLLFDTIQKSMIKFAATSQDLGEALYQLGSAGLTTEESLAAFEPTMKAIVATEADVAETVKLVAGLYMNYGTQLGEATSLTEKFVHINDVLVAAFRDHLVELNEMRDALKQSVTAGIQVGLGLEDMTGILAVLHDHMIRAGTAGRGLQVVFQQIAQQPELFMEAFGVMFDPKKPMDFLNIMKRVSVQMSVGALTVEDISDIFQRMGLRGTKIFITLAKHINEVETAINDLKTSSAGAVDEIGFERLEDPAKQIKMLSEALMLFIREGISPAVWAFMAFVKGMNYLVRAGEKVNDIFNGGVGYVVKITAVVLVLYKAFTWLARGLQATSYNFGFLGKSIINAGYKLLLFTAQARGATLKVEEYNAVLAGMASSYNKVKIATIGLSAAMGLLKFIGWIALIELVIFGLSSLYGYIKKVTAGVKELNEQLKELNETYIEQHAKLKKLTDLIHQLEPSKPLEERIKAYKEMIKLYPELVKYEGTLDNVLQTTWENAKVRIVEYQELAKKALKDVQDTQKNVLRKMLGEVYSKQVSVDPFRKKDVTDFLSYLQTNLPKIRKQMELSFSGKDLEQKWEQFENRLIGRYIGKYSGGIVTVFESIKPAAQEAIQDVNTYVDALTENTLINIGKIAEKFNVELPKKTTEGLRREFKDEFKYIGEEIKEGYEKIIKNVTTESVGFEFRFNVKSLSELFAQEFLIEEIKDIKIPIDVVMEEAVENVKDFAGYVTDIFAKQDIPININWNQPEIIEQVDILTKQLRDAIADTTEGDKQKEDAARRILFLALETTDLMKIKSVLIENELSKNKELQIISHNIYANTLSEYAGNIDNLKILETIRDIQKQNVVNLLEKVGLDEDYIDLLKNEKHFHALIVKLAASNGVLTAEELEIVKQIGTETNKLFDRDKAILDLKYKELDAQRELNELKAKPNEIELAHLASYASLFGNTVIAKNKQHLQLIEEGNKLRRKEQDLADKTILSMKEGVGYFGDEKVQQQLDIEAQELKNQLLENEKAIALSLIETAEIRYEWGEKLKDISIEHANILRDINYNTLSFLSNINSITGNTIDNLSKELDIYKAIEDNLRSRYDKEVKALKRLDAKQGFERNSQAIDDQRVKTLQLSLDLLQFENETLIKQINLNKEINSQAKQLADSERDRILTTKITEIEFNNKLLDVYSELSENEYVRMENQLKQIDNQKEIINLTTQKYLKELAYLNQQISYNEQLNNLQNEYLARGENLSEEQKDTYEKQIAALVSVIQLYKTEAIIQKDQILTALESQNYAYLEQEIELMKINRQLLINKDLTAAIGFGILDAVGYMENIGEVVREGAKEIVSTLQSSLSNVLSTIFTGDKTRDAMKQLKESLIKSFADMQAKLIITVTFNRIFRDIGKSLIGDLLNPTMAFGNHVTRFGLDVIRFGTIIGGIGGTTAITGTMPSIPQIGAGISLGGGGISLGGGGISIGGVGMPSGGGGGGMPAIPSGGYGTPMSYLPLNMQSLLSQTGVSEEPEFKLSLPIINPSAIQPSAQPQGFWGGLKGLFGSLFGMGGGVETKGLGGMKGLAFPFMAALGPILSAISSKDFMTIQKALGSSLLAGGTAGLITMNPVIGAIAATIAFIGQGLIGGYKALKSPYMKDYKLGKMAGLIGMSSLGGAAIGALGGALLGAGAGTLAAVISGAALGGAGSALGGAGMGALTGALTGAKAGMVSGGIWGAIIGAIGGTLWGMFSASSTAKHREKQSERAIKTIGAARKSINELSGYVGLDNIGQFNKTLNTSLWQMGNALHYAKRSHSDDTIDFVKKQNALYIESIATILGGWSGESTRLASEGNMEGAMSIDRYLAANLQRLMRVSKLVTDGKYLKKPLIQLIGEALQRSPASKLTLSADVLNIIKASESFAVGTPLIDKDKFVYVHKGEAIVPARQNPFNPEASQSDINRAENNKKSILGGMSDLLEKNEAFSFLNEIRSLATNEPVTSDEMNLPLLSIRKAVRQQHDISFSDIPKFVSPETKNIISEAKTNLLNSVFIKYPEMPESKTIYPEIPNINIPEQKIQPVYINTFSSKSEQFDNNIESILYRIADSINEGNDRKQPITLTVNGRVLGEVVDGELYSNYKLKRGRLNSVLNNKKTTINMDRR